MEWGNLIINPRFQKGGLVRQMAHFVSKTARQCGGGYLLGAADKHLAPLYLSLGFEIIDTKVVCPFPGWEVDSCCLALFLKS